MGGKSKARGPCVYCGRPATTADHIPPKTIFGATKPTDMIEVPACRECNNGASRDDEYFKQISLTAGAEGVQAAVDAQASFFRSIERQEARGMRRDFFSRVVPVEVRAGAGLFAGQTLGVRIRLDRLDKVFNRIIRGLFWTHQGRRLPDGYEAEWQVMPRPGLFTSILPSAYAVTYRMLENYPVVKVGDGTAFQYRYATDPDDQNKMTFRLEFYQAIGFLGFTGELEGDEISISVIVPKRSAPPGMQPPPGPASGADRPAD